MFWCADGQASNSDTTTDQADLGMYLIGSPGLVPRCGPDRPAAQ
jgi:hypothetical protein